LCFKGLSEIAFRNLNKIYGYLGAFAFLQHLLAA
jgi:hypothetical protein